jgi:oxygen-independent coproporphyrinogen-3 oxidase
VEHSNLTSFGFDAELLKKYDTSGPRYTSYPTAPQFTTDFSVESTKEEILATNEDEGKNTPISLYIHLPFCESVCFFCGCNVTFTSDRKRPAPYTDLVVQEMDSIAPLIQPERQVVQLHWGGGTPTFFAPDQLKKLHEATLKRFKFAPHAEVGLEVDPRETSSEHLKVLEELGFNRLSMGVQDFDPQVQKAVNRIQSEEMTGRTIKEARERGFKSISVDLIYGLPFQTEKSFSTTLEKILRLDPDRIAVFNFAYLPELIRHQKAIKADALPSPNEKLAILRRCITEFTQAGYRYVGMDHFAKKQDELCLSQDAGTLYRNFQGYTTHAGCDLYAFGVSAISQIGRTYSQNQKNIHEYESAILKSGLATTRGIRLTDDDLLRREVIMRLMCDFRLDTERIGQKFQIDFASYFMDDLNQLESMKLDGLWKWENKIMNILPAGRLLVRNICMAFDAYLKAKPSVKFSRTV